MNTLFLP